MKTIEGIYTNARIMTDNAQDYAIAQVKALCDNPVFEKENVVCMPDIHPGKVSTIGFTATVSNRYEKGIMPIIIGTDIGCGITAIKLEEKRFEFQKLDKVIRETVPSGFEHWQDFGMLHRYFHTDAEFVSKRVHISDNTLLSFATLGGGNHFIEIDKDPDDEKLWLLVHSGSRALGAAVCNAYLDIAHKNHPEIPYELGVLFGDDAHSYLSDCEMADQFAAINRRAIALNIIKKMKWHLPKTIIDSVHNTFNTANSDDGSIIIRKGAIPAYADQDVVIPINAKDGVIIGKGKGNLQWNYSAPHGAGRIMNRADVKATHTVSEYKKEMKGIYSPSINASTLDEAPFAYRSIEQILPLIEDTVQVTKILKPVYNFKAGGKK